MKAGAMLVDNYEELLETAVFFAKAGICEAPGVAVLSTSGGAAIMAADKAEVHQVPLPQPAAATTAVLLELIPEFGSARNPCDVTAQVVSDPIPFRKSAGALIEDQAYGALVVPVVYAYDVLKPRIELLGDLARQTGKPVCVVWLPMWIEGPGAQGADSSDSVAMFRSMDTCFATLARWRKWSAMQQEQQVAFVAATSEETRARARAVLTGTVGDILSERPAKALLASYGVPMVTDVLVRSADAAAEAARMRYPVVLKVDSALIPHKTEAGVVRLDIPDESALRVAYAEIMANGLKVAPLEAINGVLVQQMIPKGLELIVGARIDPMFGPLIVVGLGGILVELVKDSAVALAPVSAGEALRLLQGLKGYRLLQGFRGSPPVDVDALARIISLVSEFASDFRDQISELDVNPLICTGDRIIGVDALIARQTGLLPSASSPGQGARA
jgi:acetyl-CoA synthetase